MSFLYYIKPNPVYTLSRLVSSVDEQSSFTITLSTMNVPDGVQVPYVITGVSSADIGGQSLSGVFTVVGGVSSLSILVTADNLLEGEETFVLSLTGPGRMESISVGINDTSYPVGLQVVGTFTNYSTLSALNYQSGDVAIIMAYNTSTGTHPSNANWTRWNSANDGTGIAATFSYRTLSSSVSDWGAWSSSTGQHGIVLRNCVVSTESYARGAWSQLLSYGNGPVALSGTKRILLMSVNKSLATEAAIGGFTRYSTTSPASSYIQLSLDTYSSSFPMTNVTLSSSVRWVSFVGALTPS